MSRFLLFALALGLIYSVSPASINAQEKEERSPSSNMRTTQDGPTGGCTFEIEDLFKKVAGSLGGPMTKATLGMIDLFSDAPTLRNQDAKAFIALAKRTTDAKMQTGTVKFFNEKKGFGFITPENGEKDVFVHVNGLIDEIREGDKVNYELKEGKKGLNAIDVKVV